MSSQPIKRIPYGLADYGRMRQDNSYYVDKTHFIPLLEAQPYYPDIQFGYLVELKYIPRSEFSTVKLQEKRIEAETQLARYANDPRLQAVLGRVTLKKLVLIYQGWELAYREEWNSPTS
ncbi:MAG: hypothetical protein U0350_45895 [Caldilineaceae bacterium]